jgi:methanogenic corrinoid protein MtbC1
MADAGAASPAVAAVIEALLAQDRLALEETLRSATEPLMQIEQLVVPALETIGQRWELGELSLAQVYMSGRLCEQVVDLVLPPGDPARTDLPPMAIAVLEDYHMLGLRIVYSALRASGFALLNYGRCDLDTLVGRVQADRLAILLVSVLMLPSALRVKDLRARLSAVGCATRVVVGGAPFRFDAQLWREVGADAMGASGADAVAIVRRLAAEGRSTP